MTNREELLRFLNDFAGYLTGYTSQDPAIHHNYFDANRRYNGGDWSQTGLTMIGMQRMQNIQTLLLDVIDNNVAGDFIETGVWRGGACIFAATILKMLEITDRRVWVCDSFSGLPKPDPKYSQDAGDIHHTIPELAISLESVRANFEKFDLLSDQVHFVPGWFCDTLPGLKNETFSILRLDGDMYSSTTDALENLYPRLSPGGYVIIDDWGLPPCRQAVNDYRDQHNITDTIVLIEEVGSSCYWQKT